MQEHSISNVDVHVAVRTCASESRRVGKKRVKCITHIQRKLYKSAQAKRQKTMHDEVDGVLVFHIFCCFDLFVHRSWIECMGDINGIVDEDVQGRLSECIGNSVHTHAELWLRGVCSHEAVFYRKPTRVIQVLYLKNETSIPPLHGCLKFCCATTKSKCHITILILLCDPHCFV